MIGGKMGLHSDQWNPSMIVSPIEHPWNKGSTVLYLVINVGDALEVAQRIEL